MLDEWASAAPAGSVAAALDALRGGRPVILVDDEDREDEADLVLPAQFASPEWLAFFIREVRGLVCVALEGAQLDRLGIPLMTARNRSAHGTPFTVSVEAATVGTGISAADRAETIRALINPSGGPTDVVSPGHVFPLRAAPGGLAERRGHTEGSVALCRLAGLQPAAVIAEMLGPDGAVLRGTQVHEFAALHRFQIVSVDAVARHMELFDSGTDEHNGTGSPTLHRAAETTLPTRHGEFRLLAYANGGEPHLALTRGDVRDGPPPLTRIHSECLTGDVLGSRRCDCGPQLELALAMIADQQRGVLVYLRQEGRGIGLTEKLRAYALQDDGLDTVDANVALGHVADGRDYGIAAAILADLGVHEVRLLTNNPAKVVGLERSTIRVTDRVALVAPHDPVTQPYLRAKRDRLGHLLEAG